jgi:hypothetical protein
MHAIARDQLGELRTKLVLWVRGDVVELIHRDQAVVEGLDAELFDGIAESSVWADQDVIGALQEGADRLRLATLSARRVAEIPFRLDMPVGQKPNSESGSSAKLDPIDFSGTVMMALRSP